MKFFEGITNEVDLKQRYKELAKEYHPDMGGCVETMKKINVEYDRILVCILSGRNFFGSSLEEKLADEKQLREKVVNISSFDGLIIEICGSWLWVSGNTKAYKEELKKENFKWSRKKGCWYFHTGIYRKRGKKVFSMSEIRDSHGSISVNRNNFKRACIA